MMDGKLFDKKGKPIQPYDLLKVYHFTAALRRQKHYMYKHVLGVVTLGKEKNAAQYLKLSSLSECGHTYHEKLDGRTLDRVEIIQRGKAK